MYKTSVHKLDFHSTVKFFSFRFFFFDSMRYLSDAMVTVAVKAIWDIHVLLFVDKLSLTEQI